MADGWTAGQFHDRLKDDLFLFLQSSQTPLAEHENEHRGSKLLVFTLFMQIYVSKSTRKSRSRPCQHEKAPVTNRITPNWSPTRDCQYRTHEVNPLRPSVLKRLIAELHRGQVLEKWFWWWLPRKCISMHVGCEFVTFAGFSIPESAN